jgi:serine/threonine protein kinase
MTITMVIVLNLWRRKISRDTNNALRLRETQLEEGYRNALSNLEQGWIVEWADLKLTKLIARGSYGEVWKSKWAMLPQNIDVAVKKIMVTPTIMTQDVNVNGVSKKTKRPSNPIEKIFKDNEIKLLMRTRHRRVCLFLGAGRTDSGEIFMVHEYVPGGNLREVLDDLTIFLSMSRCINIARDIAEGMEFLHGRSLIHRDLKSLNVLIDEAGRAKIADFGISRFTSAKERKNRLKMRPTIAVVKNKELRMTFSKDEEEEKKGEEDLRAVPAETKTSGTFSSQRTSSETKPGRQKRRSSNRGESAEMTGNRGSILW